MSSVKVVTPGKLMWVNITGEGKESMSGKMQYLASIDMTEDAAAPFIKSLHDLWEEHKPSGWVVTKADKKENPKLTLGAAKGPFSMGYKIIDDEEDKDTFVRFEFKTGTTYNDAKEVKIKVYNAKNNEVHLGDKQIGNGSIGAVSGMAAIYPANPGKVIPKAGVTMYLSFVQLKKFVEFRANTGFDIYEDEDDFISVDEDGVEGLDQPDGRPEL